MGADGDDVVLRQGSANHKRGAESVGGTLTATDHRLIFRPHSANLSRAAFIRPIGDVTGWEEFGLLRNGLAIRFKDGSTERFYVFHRADWIKLLDAKRAR